MKVQLVVYISRPSMQDNGVAALSLIMSVPMICKSCSIVLQYNTNRSVLLFDWCIVCKKPVLLIIEFKVLPWRFQIQCEINIFPLRLDKNVLYSFDQFKMFYLCMFYCYYQPNHYRICTKFLLVMTKY